MEIIEIKVPIGLYRTSINLRHYTKLNTFYFKFSKEMNKLYCKINVQCPMRVKVTSEPPQGSIIRLVAVYKKDEHKNEHIKRCANHANSKEFNESKSKGELK